MPLLSICDELSAALRPLRFGPPVEHVYHPLDYARPMWAEYLQRWGHAQGRVLLVGMNPGPWGMAQTGIPFGEVAAVQGWMGLQQPFAPPAAQHPRVPIEGLKCWRNEVSGQRLWGWAHARFGRADAFFARFFVLNYCPLCFLEAGGRNRTPDKLPRAERTAVETLCDAALAQSVTALAPRLVVGVGAYAEERARAALGDRVPIGRILHPSPANPLASRDWPAQIEAQLRALGVAVP